MATLTKAAILAGAWLGTAVAAHAELVDPLKDAVVRKVRDAFRIETLALFDTPIPPAIRGATCTRNETGSLTYCATGTVYETSPSGTFGKTLGYTLDGNGRIVHVAFTRREFPLERAGFDQALRAMGARYGGAPETIAFQGKTAAGDEVSSVVAAWGGIKLLRLSEAELLTVAAGGVVGHAPLIDHRLDVRLSAQQRDPVYKIEGTAGFVVQLRAVSDVRTDIVQRMIYVPGFEGDEDQGSVAARAEPRALPLDPLIAYHLARQVFEQEQIAATERQAAEERRIAEERRAAEERARREEAERKAAEERRIADERAREEAARKAAEERRVAEERARREEAERKAAEERARREDMERKVAAERREAEDHARREDAVRKAAEERRAAEALRIAEESARREEAERKAAEERRAIEERARRAEAELKAASERARRAEAERLAAEERVRQAESERHAAEERARKMEAERKAAEERARREAEERKAAEAQRLEAERRAAEERARREAAERRAADEKKAEEARREAAERARREAAERRAAEEKKAEEARREAAERARREAQERRAADEKKAEEARREAAARRAAEEKARQEEAQRKAAAARAEADRAAAEQRRTEAEAARRADEARRAGAAPERPASAERAAAPERRVAEADEKRTDASSLSREAWIRMATARARSGTAAWAFMRARDRISDDLLLQAQAVFQGGDRLSVEIAFECNIDAGKRLKAYVRAFDTRTKASLRIPPEDGHANAVRGSVTLDEGAPQTAFLFPERDERQASIVEIPVTQDDIKKSTPRAQAWLRHYQVSLKLRLAQGEIVANIHPYDDNLRRVFEGCTP